MKVDSITTVNPATGDVLAHYQSMSPAMINQVLVSMVDVQEVWAATDLSSRLGVMRRVGEVLHAQADRLAYIATTEMGKPITEALAEVNKCARAFEYTADMSPSFLADESVESGASRSWVRYEPLGVILAIMPWNYPYWQVARCAASVLAAGNAIVLKHAPNVMGCALAFEEVLTEAGLPEGLFRALVVAEPDVPDVVDGLIADSRIAAVTLTGSVRAGSHVAAAAGGAIKKSVLELGGSDPFVVLSDAALDAVVAKAVAARFQNAGQSCLSAKRFIVHESIAQEFARRLTAAVEELVVGDPTDPRTDVGPLARSDLAENAERQITASVQAGATILTGGARLPLGPTWFAPTVLVDVALDMPVMTEETFAPVAVVVPFANDDQAVDLANCTGFGLGASVWSKDVDHALRVGSRICSGALFINQLVASDPRFPFGGVKQSGFGRELGAIGAHEFVNARTVLVQDIGGK